MARVEAARCSVCSVSSSASAAAARRELLSLRVAALEGRERHLERHEVAELRERGAAGVAENRLAARRRGDGGQIPALGGVVLEREGFRLLVEGARVQRTRGWGRGGRRPRTQLAFELELLGVVTEPGRELRHRAGEEERGLRLLLLGEHDLALHAQHVVARRVALFFSQAGQAPELLQTRHPPLESARPALLGERPEEEVLEGKDSLTLARLADEPRGGGAPLARLLEGATPAGEIEGVAEPEVVLDDAGGAGTHGVLVLRADEGVVPRERRASARSLRARSRLEELGEAALGEDPLPRAVERPRLRRGVGGARAEHGESGPEKMPSGGRFFRPSGPTCRRHHASPYSWMMWECPLAGVSA
jgi:hypothetical protein